MKAMNLGASKHNSSTNGRNINNMYATQQEPKKQSKENPVNLWRAKNDGKSGSQLMGAKMCTSGPTSARGSQQAVDAKIRRAVYAAGGQNSLTRRDASAERSVSIDKKIRNQSSKYN